MFPWQLSREVEFLLGSGLHEGLSEVPTLYEPKACPLLLKPLRPKEIGPGIGRCPQVACSFRTYCVISGISFHVRPLNLTLNFGNAYSSFPSISRLLYLKYRGHNTTQRTPSPYPTAGPLFLSPEGRVSPAILPGAHTACLHTFIWGEDRSSAKDSIKRVRRPTEWERIFANHIPGKSLVSRIYKELLQLKTKKTNYVIFFNYVIFKMGKGFKTDTTPKRQIPNEHMGKRSLVTGSARQNDSSAALGTL